MSILGVEEILSKTEDVKAEFGQDEALGFAAYLMGKNWSSKARSFARYDRGIAEAKRRYANTVSASMLRA